MIELSHFDAMLKVSTLYLAAMNIQNRIWNLYSSPDLNTGGGNTASAASNVALAMVQEMQRLAKKSIPVAKATVLTNGSETEKTS